MSPHRYSYALKVYSSAYSFKAQEGRQVHSPLQSQGIFFRAPHCVASSSVLAPSFRMISGILQGIVYDALPATHIGYISGHIARYTHASPSVYTFSATLPGVVYGTPSRYLEHSEILCYIDSRAYSSTPQMLYLKCIFNTVTGYIPGIFLERVYSIVPHGPSGAAAWHLLEFVCASSPTWYIAL